MRALTPHIPCIRVRSRCVMRHAAANSASLVQVREAGGVGCFAAAAAAAAQASRLTVAYHQQRPMTEVEVGTESSLQGACAN
jgi:hypothetical protein